MKKKRSKRFQRKKGIRFKFGLSEFPAFRDAMSACRRKWGVGKPK